MQHEALYHKHYYIDMYFPAAESSLTKPQREKPSIWPFTCVKLILTSAHVPGAEPCLLLLVWIPLWSRVLLFERQTAAFLSWQAHFHNCACSVGFMPNGWTPSPLTHFVVSGTGQRFRGLSEPPLERSNLSRNLNSTFTPPQWCHQVKQPGPHTTARQECYCSQPATLWTIRRHWLRRCPINNEAGVEAAFLFSSSSCVCTAVAPALTSAAVVNSLIHFPWLDKGVWYLSEDLWRAKLGQFAFYYIKQH